ncbi:NAD/NADP octopine/nopaline dehydrogenase family protein [Roseomonas sp. CCTCC AB2023176]|uniref:NAD/NADP octopine/nopaline dehydrogenase family protein n=1 Tax=Roseomonas sp. CCTCC AB2023176 TaxID=3342640 RepID=UPI0035DE1542
MQTTPVTARRPAPGRVRVAAIRAAVDMAAVPSAAAPQLGTVATDLFGHASPVLPNALAAALSNANPIIHAALALTNATRIERGEPWPQYEVMTEATCRLMERMAEERDALAAAFAIPVLPLAESLHRANGVPVGPLHAMAAAIAASRSAVLGPAGMDTRYVREDVPYGLAVYLRLAEARGLPMPVTAAVTTALGALWGADLRANPLLDALDLSRLDDDLRDGIGRA